ncbi:hypothetical protein OB955_10435 [Halobacteria archaeon AArc-m2/3/4]|uniref:Uncharacterized protein n=1 Tax=Natronoglomus mannanivorans TaxID=2979990 RepID=A0AAP2YUX5_9EURY|nr:hypothetical protein [Halobacteria archaeon AArc-xg1-1]MCU4973159.1 hypothetical protein [Halobacteria archaeon AArc-m2/3/4]
MASKLEKACPNCGDDDVWIEEQPRRLEFGCNLCNYQWARAKST